MGNRFSNRGAGTAKGHTFVLRGLARPPDRRAIRGGFDPSCLVFFLGGELGSDPCPSPLPFGRRWGSDPSEYRRTLPNIKGLAPTYILAGAGAIGAIHAGAIAAGTGEGGEG